MQGLWIQTGNAFGRLFPLWVDFNFENFHLLFVFGCCFDFTFGCWFDFTFGCWFYFNFGCWFDVPQGPSSISTVEQ